MQVTTRTMQHLRIEIEGHESQMQEAKDYFKEHYPDVHPRSGFNDGVAPHRIFTMSGVTTNAKVKEEVTVIPPKEKA